MKKDPVRRWALPDRIFFGYGACHILAGAFLLRPPLPGFHAERVIPGDGFAGAHIYVTNGKTAFDFHGYCCRERLLSHHAGGWTAHSPGWNCLVENVAFDLLDTAELNLRRMLGPDQFLHDPVPRALGFIDRVDHEKAAAKIAAAF